MSGTSTRVRNRQIRRAFGEEAIETINQQGATLQSVVLPRLMTLGKEFAAHTLTIDSLKRDHDALALQVNAETVRLSAAYALSRLSFLGRLRWFVTGRL